MISADKYNKNTTTKNADNNHNNMEGILQSIRRKAPKIHCITNPVTMQDVANILLAAGGSAIMARDPEEVSEITSICQGTLLNTGVPDERILRSCILAGTRAHTLRHSVVLDPVGVGASSFRRKNAPGTSGTGISRCYPMQSGGGLCTELSPVSFGKNIPPCRCGKQSLF